MSFHIYDSNGAIKTSLPTVSDSSITGGSIENVPIGQTTPAAGYFSALRLKIGGFFGIFTHANSADRTYTLPNYDATLATLAGTETFDNKTLTTPTVASLTNMQHTHQNAAGGGTLDTAAIASGTLALARGGTNADNSSQTANKVFATPSSGGAGNMSIRALVDADIPATLASHTLNGATLTGAIDANAATFRAPVTASALTATEGYWKWDSTNKCVVFYDGTRERITSGWGYQADVFPWGFIPTSAYGASSTLAAVSGTILIPMYLSGHFLLQSVQILNNDTATARSWRWDLYVDLDNAANAVTRVATSSGSDAFTPSAASIRTLAATSAPVYLPPGHYFLAVQNNHASNNFAFGIASVGSNFSPTTAKTKTTGSTNGATLDIIAATWTSIAPSVAASLRGRVAADSVAW